MDDLEAKIIICVAKALGVATDQVTLQSTQDEIEEWDSLSHFVILDELDREFNGVSSKSPELGTATSIAELIAVIRGC